MPDVKSLFDLLGKYDNLHEPEPFINKTPTILGVTITFMVISWVCVALRLYTRFRVIYSPGWDDLFVVISLLSTTLGSICICYATKWGMGKHVLLLESDHITKYLNTFYVANASYCMSTACIKISLLLQYLRVYERGTAANRLCKILAVFVALWGIAYSILGWVPCVPVHMFWDRTPTSDATCFGYGSLDPTTFAATYESHTAVNMALDLVVLAIPMPLLFRPGTQTNVRVALLGLLLMGVIVNVVSIWRLVSIVQTRAATHPTFDPTWYGPISIVLAAIEVDTAMVCACVPVFWPMLRNGLLGTIFVTREVKVTHERLGSTKDLELKPTCDRAGSEASLHTAGETNRAIGTNGRDSHYLDEHVKAQVDPFSQRKSHATTVETEGRGKNGKKDPLSSLFRSGSIEDIK